MNLGDIIVKALNTLLKLDPRGIAVHEDAFVRCVSHNDYAVTEGDRAVWITAERMAGGIERAIYASQVRMWEPPHENDPFTQEDRERVVSMLTEYFDKSKTTYRIE